MSPLTGDCFFLFPHTAYRQTVGFRIIGPVNVIRTLVDDTIPGQLVVTLRGSPPVACLLPIVKFSAKVTASTGQCAEAAFVGAIAFFTPSVGFFHLRSRRVFSP